MASDEERKAEEILKKRRLAAKGLKETPDGRAIDPMEDFDPLDENRGDADDDQGDIAARAAAIGVVTRRSG
jgi:hypothetical protein